MNPYAPPAAPDPSPRGGGKARINVGVDIGTSKICIAVGETKPNRTLNIMTVIMAPSLGVAEDLLRTDQTFHLLLIKLICF